MTMPIKTALFALGVAGLVFAGEGRASVNVQSGAEDARIEARDPSLGELAEILGRDLGIVVNGEFDPAATVKGNYEGPLARVLRDLLRNYNYFVDYAPEKGAISRITIVGERRTPAPGTVAAAGAPPHGGGAAPSPAAQAMPNVAQAVPPSAGAPPVAAGPPRPTDTPVSKEHAQITANMLASAARNLLRDPNESAPPPSASSDYGSDAHAAATRLAMEQVQALAASLRGICIEGTCGNK